ncbi:MerR family transcriptional regulator [Micromonospora sp. NPDC092111]|uniref:MerR family transcriptional regulator n=1 Tax=Micromonospora sp. NPDC092111 TaxID=3364289 RepID=UPI003809DC70
MRIGELARVTGSSPRALRHYEREGLISSWREANGYRDYDETTVARVRNIRHFLAVGLTVADIRPFLGCLDGDVAAAPPSPAGLRIARDRLAVIDQRIAAQLAARDRLARALRRADDAGRRDVRAQQASGWTSAGASTSAAGGSV